MNSRHGVVCKIKKMSTAEPGYIQQKYKSDFGSQRYACVYFISFSTFFAGVIFSSDDVSFSSVFLKFLRKFLFQEF